jgi:hypothetical protein
MNAALRAVLAVAVLVLWGALAAAQDGRGSWGVPAGGYPYPSMPAGSYGMYGGYGYLPYDHASTLEEGLLRGQAAWLRAYGQGNYWNAQAMKDAETAYAQDLENRKRALETYCELARINQEARAAQRGPRPSREDAIRYAKEGFSQPLPSTQFDTTFGVLRWPELLQRPEFAKQRMAIDRLLPDFCLRPDEVGCDTCGQITRLAVELEGKLKQEINSVNPMTYLAAKKFIESLAYEVQHMSASRASTANVVTDTAPHSGTGRGAKPMVSVARRSG